MRHTYPTNCHRLCVNTLEVVGVLYLHVCKRCIYIAITVISESCVFFQFKNLGSNHGAEVAEVLVFGEDINEAWIFITGWWFQIFSIFHL